MKKGENQFESDYSSITPCGNLQLAALECLHDAFINDACSNAPAQAFAENLQPQPRYSTSSYLSSPTAQWPAMRPSLLHFDNFPQLDDNPAITTSEEARNTLKDNGSAHTGAEQTIFQGEKMISGGKYEQLTSSPEQDKHRKLRHPRDTFNASMVEGASYDPDYDMPLIRADTFAPTALVPFSVAKRSDWTDFDCAVHFCERDQDIEPFWSNPDKYIPKLQKFQGAIGLDLSTCVDFPRALKEWNTYRNRACVYKLQQAGIKTIPLLRGDPDVLSWEIAGLERGCAIAVSPRSCIQQTGNRKRFVRGLKNLVDSLDPSLIISYGGNSFGCLDYPINLGIPVRQYASRGRGGLGGGDLNVEIR